MTLGRVEPRSGEIKIAAPLPGGRIAEVLVKANEDVFAGELLARLDDEEALARVAEADAQVALHKRARNDQSAPAASADRRKAEDAAADAERSSRRRARGARQDHRRLAGGPRRRAAISMRRAPRCRARRIACANGAMRL